MAINKVLQKSVKNKSCTKPKNILSMLKKNTIYFCNWKIWYNFTGSSLLIVIIDCFAFWAKIWFY